MKALFPSVPSCKTNILPATSAAFVLFVTFCKTSG